VYDWREKKRKTNTNNMSVPQLPQEMVNKILYDFKGFQPYPFINEFKREMISMRWLDEDRADLPVSKKWPHGIWRNKFLNADLEYIGRTTPWNFRDDADYESEEEYPEFWDWFNENKDEFIFEDSEEETEEEKMENMRLLY